MYLFIIRKKVEGSLQFSNGVVPSYPLRSSVYPVVGVHEPLKAFSSRMVLVDPN